MWDNAVSSIFPLDLIVSFHLIISSIDSISFNGKFHFVYILYTSHTISLLCILMLYHIASNKKPACL